MGYLRPLLKVLLALGLGAALLAGGAAAAPERNVAVVATKAQPATEPRIALVIGNTDYPNATLANPVNDARAIAQRLSALRFRVTRLENASQDQMYEALRAFGDELRGGGVGLFYYAGHALQVRGRNYLLPARAKIEREDEIIYRTVDTGQILDKMENARNRVNIVILDACRNNPFGREFRNITPGLAVVDAPHNTLIAFATAPGAVASDGGGSNGLYTQHLLQAMEERGASLEDVFKRVRAGVRRESAGRQVPWESTSLEVDFYFDPPSASFTPPPPPSAAPTALPPDPLTIEVAFWDSVKGSTDPDDYRAYLKRYPDGQFAVLAGNRLRALRLPTPAIAVTPAPAALSAIAVMPHTPGPAPAPLRPPVVGAPAPLVAVVPIPAPVPAPPPAALPAPGAVPAPPVTAPPATPLAAPPAAPPAAATPAAVLAPAATRPLPAPGAAAPTPTPLRALPGPAGEMRALAVSRTGGQALTGAADRSLRVWDLTHGKEQRRLAGSTAAVTATAISPDGRLFLSGSADRGLRMWDAASGTELARLEGHAGRVSGLLFGPTARYAISAADDGELIVWDLPSGRLIRRAQAAAGPVPGLALSADGRYLLTGAGDGLLRLWDVGSLTGLRGYGPMPAPVAAVGFADGVRRVVAVDTQGRLWSWPAEGTPDLKATRRIDSGLRPPTLAALAGDGATALLAGADGELGLWDTATGRVLWRTAAPGPRITAVALGPRGTFGLSASDDGRLLLWATTP